MKILVPIKRVIDYNAKSRIKADGSGAAQLNAKMLINPFDEMSLEDLQSTTGQRRAGEV